MASILWRQSCKTQYHIKCGKENHDDIELIEYIVERCFSPSVLLVNFPHSGTRYLDHLLESECCHCSFKFLDKRSLGGPSNKATVAGSSVLSIKA